MSADSRPTLDSPEDVSHAEKSGGVRTTRPGAPGARTSSTWRPALGPGAVLVLLLTFLGAWALSSPVGSSPDEDYHLASIWCAQGDREGACEVPTGEQSVMIPPQVRNAPCFAFDGAISGACQSPDQVFDDEELVETERGNFGAHAGSYPPGFYNVMSVFVGPDVERSVLVMRMVNVLLAVAMIGLTYVGSEGRARRALVATSVVTLVPLGVFIVPSVNPSSWAVVSALTLFFGIYGFLASTRRWRTVLLGAVSVASVAMASSARADASVYAVIAIGAACVVALAASGGLSRSFVVRSVLPVVLAIVSAVSYLSAGQAGAAGQSAGRGPSNFVFVAWDALGYWVGALGLSPLGWLDTPMSAIVWVSTTAAFFAVLFVAVGNVGRWRGAMVALVALAGVLLPTYIEATAEQPLGSVQARYVYPLLIVLAAVATLSTERRGYALSPVQRWLVVCAVGAASVVSLYENIRRYITGTDVAGARLVPGEWWWSGVPFSAEVVWLVGSAAAVGALVIASRLLVDRRPLSARHPVDD
jgi:hypothetical protein